MNCALSVNAGACLSPKDELAQEYLRIKQYAVGRKYHESLHENVYYVAGSIMEQAPAFQ